jgi:hypothetical protein
MAEFALTFSPYALFTPLGTSGRAAAVTHYPFNRSFL